VRVVVGGGAQFSVHLLLVEEVVQLGVEFLEALIEERGADPRTVKVRVHVPVPHGTPRYPQDGHSRAPHSARVQ
jgi:hypothetical protein